MAGVRFPWGSPVPFWGTQECYKLLILLVGAGFELPDPQSPRLVSG